MTLNEKPASPTQGELAELVARLDNYSMDWRDRAADAQPVRDAIKALRAISALDRTTLPPTEEYEGLSEWAGWDQTRFPWGATKHKDAVLEALFRGPWSVEDAAALLGFIDRTWTRRPSPQGTRS